MIPLVNVTEWHGLDTNILTRWLMPNDPHHGFVVEAIRALGTYGTPPVITVQTLAEFWNALTRPAENNGFGFNIGDAEHQLQRAESLFVLRHETTVSFQLWRRWIVKQKVIGKQVHDARLASVLAASGVNHLLTLNPRDFKRFGINVVTPGKLVNSVRINTNDNP